MQGTMLLWLRHSLGLACAAALALFSCAVWMALFEMQGLETERYTTTPAPTASLVLTSTETPAVEANASNEPTLNVVGLAYVLVLGACFFFLEPVVELVERVVGRGKGEEDRGVGEEKRV